MRLEATTTARPMAIPGDGQAVDGKCHSECPFANFAIAFCLLLALVFAAVSANYRCTTASKPLYFIDSKTLPAIKRANRQAATCARSSRGTGEAAFTGLRQTCR
jgi:hypothetical protein